MAALVAAGLLVEATAALDLPHHQPVVGEGVSCLVACGVWVGAVVGLVVAAGVWVGEGVGLVVAAGV